MCGQTDRQHALQGTLYTTTDRQTHRQTDRQRLPNLAVLTTRWAADSQAWTTEPFGSSRAYPITYIRWTRLAECHSDSDASARLRAATAFGPLPATATTVWYLQRLLTFCQLAVRQSVGQPMRKSAGQCQCQLALLARRTLYDLSAQHPGPCMSGRHYPDSHVSEATNTLVHMYRAGDSCDEYASHTDEQRAVCPSHGLHSSNTSDGCSLDLRQTTGASARCLTMRSTSVSIVIPVVPRACLPTCILILLFWLHCLCIGNFADKSGLVTPSLAFDFSRSPVSRARGVVEERPQ